MWRVPALLPSLFDQTFSLTASLGSDRLPSFEGERPVDIDRGVPERLCIVFRDQEQLYISLSRRAYQSDAIQYALTGVGAPHLPSS